MSCQDRRENLEKQIANVLGKIKRQGKFVGKRADWKKAIITLTADSKPIEFFEGM